MKREQTSSPDQEAGMKSMNNYSTAKDTQSNCFLQFDHRSAGVTVERKQAHKVSSLSRAPPKLGLKEMTPQQSTVALLGC